MMHKDRNHAYGTCLLVLAAVLALRIPPAHAQQAPSMRDEERETLRLHPVVKAIDDAAATVRSWMGDNKEDAPIDEFDEAAAKAANDAWQARQNTEHWAKLRAKSPEVRASAFDACVRDSEYVRAGKPLSACEREHLLPEEIQARQTARVQQVRDRYRSAAVDIGARDTVLLEALKRECPDNAHPSTYCRELVQDAEALGRKARELLDDPDALAYLKERGRDHMPQSFFRARQVVLQPGAESHFREGMTDAGERIAAPASASEEATTAQETSPFLRRTGVDMDALHRQSNQGVAWANGHDQRERARAADYQRSQEQTRRWEAEREAREHQAAQQQAQAQAQRQAQQQSGGNMLNTLMKVVETGVVIRGIQQQQGQQRYVPPAADGTIRMDVCTPGPKYEAFECHCKLYPRSAGCGR